VRPEDNFEVYEHTDVVRSYLDCGRLTRGEQLLFSRYKADFAHKKVLDLGVGGGRTTPALTATSAEYWGVDYSGAMVVACRQRYAGLVNARFLQDDARYLEHCPDNFFDTAVFSFNGIDIVDIEGRKAVLDTVRRVLAPGGIFIFSFHNAGYLETLYRYHWQKNPLRWWPNYRRRRKIRAFNGPKEQYAGRDYFFLKDGGEDFRLSNCYMRPGCQQQMLIAAGFRPGQCVGSLSGREIPLEAPDTSKDPWVYYRSAKV
jgi:ubiquinone/menaquinone biosynthesis C-methylase UbiE